MAVGLELLAGDLEPFSLPVQVAHVSEPQPGRVALRGHARLPVPLGLLPQRPGVLDSVGGQRLVEIRVHLVVLVAGVVHGALGAVELVDVGRRVRAPAPHDGVAELVGIQVVPATASGRHADAHLAELVGERVRHGLADRVARGIVEVEGAGKAVARVDPVVTELPAGTLEKRAGAVGRIVAAHVLARPRKAVADAVGHRPVAAQHVVDDRLAVDREVHCLPDLEVAGDVVAGGIRVGAVLALGARGHDGKLHAARVDGVVGLQRVALYLLVGEGRRGVGHVHLAGLRRREGRVLLHEHDDHALDLGLLAVVGGARIEDDLLTAVPLGEHVSPGADGLLAVIGAVCVLGHDAHDGKGVQKRVVGLGELDDQRGVVGRGGVLDHGEVGLRVLRAADRVQREGGVGGAHGLAVGELGVVAQLEGPGELIVGALVGRREVALETHLLGRVDEGGLDEGLVDVLAAAPGHARVEAGVGLVGRAHGDGHLARGVDPRAGSDGPGVARVGRRARRERERARDARARKKRPSGQGKALICHVNVLSAM